MKELIFIPALLLSLFASAQKELKYCGQVEKTEALFDRFPGLQDDAQHCDQILDNYTTEFALGDEFGQRDQLYIIPVVFHIIHDGGEENISDEQVIDAMEVLNRDFRMLNEDIINVTEEFQNITADIEIEFRLAQKDPFGNCTKGITRTQSPLTYDGEEDMKELIQWPRNKYMNVWVCAYAGGAAGYTFRPSSVNNNFMAAQDGIVLLHNYTGSIGTSSISRSRTLTHEVGHWINLNHTWGPTNDPGVDANCAFDDSVGDTPNTIGWTSCNLAGESCGSLDNVQNYMEYSYCSRMFTQGQRTRMRASTTSNIAQRNQLWQASNLNNTGTSSLDPLLCEADFSANKLVTCVGEEITFLDQSFNGIVEWSWNFGDGNTVSGDDPAIHKNPIHIYSEPGIYTISLTAGNGEDQVSAEKVGFIRVISDAELEAPFNEGFENDFPANTWFIENPSEDLSFEVNTNAAYSGEKSIRIRNSSITEEGLIDALVSSSYDFSNYESVTISYRWAYANKLNETDDRLRIMISTNCGSSWILKKLHRGLTTLPTAPATNLQFTPSGPDQWAYNEVVIEIADQLTSGFMVRFEWEARGGNNIYLDDINISATEIVSISEMLSPTGNDIRLYPNPVNQNATLETYLNSSTKAGFTITDLSGKTILEIPEQSYQAGPLQINMDFGQLSSGMYLLNWNGKDGRASLRFVVE